MKFSILALFALSLSASARPLRLAISAGDALKNGQDAIALNNKFKTLKVGDPCQSGDEGCINGGFAQCVNGQFTSQPCASGTICAALPLVNSVGTSITCDTQADVDARIAATGATSGNSTSVVASSSTVATSATATVTTSTSAATATSTATSQGNVNGTDGDPQSSLTLDPNVIAKGFENDGQSQPEAGQVASKTSSNNFINFCLTVPNLPITNGQQVKGGSCNPAPMGVIASVNNMPSSKFVFPKNMDNLGVNQSFTIQMAISNLATGNFVNADQNYFAAPQFTNGNGDVEGHSHVVIEQLDSLTQTKPTNPAKFVFFKGLNAQAQNGILTANVTGGLDAGVYRMASINSAANHQPVLVAIAQHGALDDMIYFTVGNNNNGNN
ncbi:hypothetical protein JAAARDRAFT_160037 [Jaapia argillacea MUCL 33604]|uniref:Carbohydrate-binding module family 19 domain-containing protein n=1 Tax=Jaapia argillacea MUCL 33604 TaxID=933084 RepID=A0A067PJ19_9AGAM|nr:hypothetical protein JAAARDRAFT_160037 [Jaapia argillacea MUCL 33604]